MQQNKNDSLGLGSSFLTLAPYFPASPPAQMDSSGSEGNQMPWHNESSGYTPDPGTKKEKAYSILEQPSKETLTPEWQRTAVGKRVGAWGGQFPSITAEKNKNKRSVSHGGCLPRVTKLENLYSVFHPPLASCSWLESGERKMFWLGNKDFSWPAWKPQGAQSLNDDSGDHKKGVPSSIYHKANWYPIEWMRT